MVARGRDHERFVRAVHRRLVVVRAAEAVGICMAAASAVALPIVLVHIYRGASAGGSLLALTILSLLAAIAVAVHRWPSVRSAAVEADRQLELSDLLATALALDDGEGRPVADVMIAEVLALADARCRHLSPSDVVLNRLGARAWGGIGLGVALVVTLAVMPLRPERSDAAAVDGARALAGAPDPTTDGPAQPTVGRASGVRRTAGDPISDEDRRFPGASNEVSQTRGADGHQPADAAGRDIASGGTASGTTAPNGAPNLPRESGSAGASPRNATGTAAGGTGERGTSGDRGNLSARGAGATSPMPGRAPGMGSDTSNAPGDAASRDGAPAAYRDLVREYFGAK